MCGFIDRIFGDVELGGKVVGDEVERGFRRVFFCDN